MFREPLINICVGDVERVSRFSTDLLAFRETFRTPETGQPDQVELRLEGLTLGFASIDAAKRMHGFAAGTGAPRSEVALCVEDDHPLTGSVPDRPVQPLRVRTGAAPTHRTCLTGRRLSVLRGRLPDAGR